MTHDDFLRAATVTLPNYKSSSQVRQQLAHVSLYPLIGPSGVGKSSIIRQLDIPLVPSDMTRERRPNEVDGEDAFFRTDYDRMNEEMVNGEFAQIAIGPDGEFYATRATSYPQRGAATMPLVASAINSMRGLGFSKVTPIFIAAPSFTEWMRRFEQQPIPVERKRRRLYEAKQSLTICLDDPGVFFVLNDELSRAVRDVKQIINGQEGYDHAKQGAARQAAKAMFDGLPAELDT